MGGDDPFERALACDRAGDLMGAVAACQMVLAQNPDHGPALILCGALACRLGRLEQGVMLLTHATTVVPADVRAWEILGDAQQALMHLAEAEQAFRQAVALFPQSAQLWCKLGIILSGSEREEEAVIAFRRSVACDDGFAPAHYHLGFSLQHFGQLEAAAEEYMRAITLQPDDARAYLDLGTALAAMGKFNEALAAYVRATELIPDWPEAHTNVGVCLKRLGRFQESIAAHRRAIAADPNHALAHFNLAVMLIMCGEFAEGWAEYHWRWRVSALKLRPERVLPGPEWRGEDLAGKTLLVYAEQGLGDVLQFCRFIPALARRGIRVVLEVHAPLVRVLSTLSGVAELVAGGDPLPSFDAHVAMMDLPFCLGVGSDFMADSIPYLAPPPDAVEKWQQRLPQGRRLKVGICWAGNPKHIDDKNRSARLADMVRAWGGLDGLQLFSLQKNQPEDSRAIAAMTGTVIDLAPLLDNFADTAAAMMSLDLIISVDTAVVHLAGALGRPVWLLLPYVPDWRWMLERTDTPWYPSMRLFRQPRFADWPDVMDRVAHALTAVIAGEEAP